MGRLTCARTALQDDRADEWLPERDIDPELVEDFDAGLERAPAATLLDMRDNTAGGEREFLVQWSDGAPDSWEPEPHVAPALIAELKARRPELFQPRASSGAGARERGSQAAPLAAGLGPGSEGAAELGSDGAGGGANGVVAHRGGGAALAQGAGEQGAQLQQQQDTGAEAESRQPASVR